MNTTCKRGHSYDEHGHVGPNGKRYCGECHKLRRLERKAKVQHQATEPDARAVRAED